MHTLVEILLLLGFCVVLPFALLSVVNDLKQRIGQFPATSRDQGPLIPDQGAEQSGR